jgi:hypothetical protein
MKIRKFREDLGYGRFSNRVAYVVDSNLLPPSLPNSRWTEDFAFDERVQAADEPSFHRVLEAVRQSGLAIVERQI